MNVRRVIAIALLALVALAGGAAVAVTPDEQDAINAAEKWLVPVDAGKGADSWAMAAEPFKASVSKSRWIAGLGELRKPYGKFRSRKAERLAHAGEQPKSDEAPGSATGDRVSIIFDTTFARGKLVNEEVTVVRENDGVWRVAGYFIR